MYLMQILEGGLCSIDPNVLNTIGLILDIVGIWSLYVFGLTKDVSKDGVIHIIMENTDEDEKRKWKIYRYISRAALGVIILGFVLQILSNHLPFELCDRFASTAVVRGEAWSNSP